MGRRSFITWGGYFILDLLWWITFVARNFHLSLKIFGAYHFLCRSVII
jgi:hypothetical protein